MVCSMNIKLILKFDCKSAACMEEMAAYSSINGGLEEFVFCKRLAGCGEHCLASFVNMGTNVLYFIECQTSVMAFMSDMNEVIPLTLQQSKNCKTCNEICIFFARFMTFHLFLWKIIVLL